MPYLFPRRFAVRQLARSCFCVTALTCALGSLPGVLLAQTPASTEISTYAIPAGPLDGALNRFAREAGVALSFDATQVRGLTTRGLNGSYSVPAGFAGLLAGSGLVAQATDAGYVLRSTGTEATIVLDPVQVEGVGGVAATEGTGSYTSPVMTIGKSAQSLRDIPQSVSVITSQRLDDQNLFSLDDALAQTTGIRVNSAGGATPYVPIYARGFAITTIQRDGVPIEIGSNFFAQPDMAIYDRVEVLRGAAGLYNGNGQPGGTINLVRKRALAENRLVTTATAGSWNNYRVEVDITGGLDVGDTVRGRLVSVYQTRDYFFDVVESERIQLYGRLEFDLADTTTVSLGALYDTRDTPYTNGMPRYTNGADLHLDRSAYLGTAWSRWNFDKPELFAELEHGFANGWRGKVALTRVEEKSDYKAATVWGAVDPQTLLGPVIGGHGIENRNGTQDGIDISLSGDFELGGREHEFVLGTNQWKLDVLALRAYPGVDGPMDVFNFDPDSVPELPTPAWQYEYEYDIRQSGYYASAQMHPLERFTVILGTRWSRYENYTAENIAGTATTFEYDGEVTPYGGLVYDLNDSWSLYGSYAEIFQAQSSFTVEGNPLDPVEGINYEAGLKGEMAGGLVNASVAVFRIDQRNRAQADPLHPTPCAGSPTNSCFVAQGEVRSEGIEAELSGRVLQNLELFAGYTYNTTEYVKDSTASGEASSSQGAVFNTITPRHMLRLWADYRSPLLQGLSIGAGINAQSDWYAGSAIKLEQGGYALWNARLGYTLDSRWKLSFNVNNLLDKRYYSRLANPNYANYYGEPRSFMLSVQGAW